MPAAGRHDLQAAMDTNGVENPSRRAQPPRRSSASTARLAGLSSENRRSRIDGLPAKEIIGAGPGVDFGLANPAFEIAGMLVLMLLPRRGVIHSATGAGKFFGGPDAACHSATMRQWRVDSSPSQFRS